MKTLILLLLILVHTNSTSAIIRGQDGRWYGNICVTQVGWQEVPWQLVGSMCYSSVFRQWGFIANV